MQAAFVDPGALRHELSLQGPALVPDGQGGHVETWTTIGSVFARIEPVRAKMAFGADQTVETTTHLIAVRWRDDIASGRRFATGTRIFDILTVHDPDETGRYLVCRVLEAGL